MTERKFDLNLRYFGAAVILIMMIAALSVSAHSGDGSMRFSHLDIEDGLSQNTVMSITQDGQGNMWFATADGLSRYDGYDFTVFRHSAEDSTTIAGNSVQKLLYDSEGRLWAGTTEGLSYYNSSREIFESYGRELSITTMAEIDADRLLVGTDGRLCIFNIAERKFSDSLPEAIATLTVRAMTRSGDMIYIGSADHGLYTYSIKDEEFRRIGLFDSEKPVQCILAQENGTLWVSTEGDGLYMINIDSQEVKNYRHTGQPDDIGSDFVRTLSMDSEGRLWIGTFEGLKIFDAVTEKFTTYSNEPFNPNSLSQNSVRCIYRDNQGGMWLGTFFGGVNYWHRLKGMFTVIQRKPDGNSLNDNIVSCIVEDSDGTVWIGTNRGGVNHYNPKTGSFEWYVPQMAVPRGEWNSNDIKAVHIIGDKVYVGAHAGGMKVIDKVTGTITPCGSGGEVSVTDVYSIIEKDMTNLYVGTLQGLYSYDTVNDVFQEVKLGKAGENERRPRLRALMIGPEGRLWAGGEDGLNVLSSDRRNELFVEQNIVPEEVATVFVQCIMESASGTVWVGARDGLYAFSGSGVRRFSVMDGLPNDIVHGIEEDSYGRLWISTDSGLSCFNPYSGDFRNFSSADALPSNQFCSGSHCRKKSGEMYFGSINGIAVFTPERLIDNPYAPAPRISNFYVFNRPVTPGDETGILEKTIGETGRIVLKHRYNSFTIGFTVANYVAGHHNEFAYMLEGIDEDWQYVSLSRRASYSRVPHGKYRFLVRAANNDGKWCAEPTVLEIKVLPMWYQTALAIILFVIAGAGLVFWAARFYIERKNMETKLALDRKEREKQEELHQMKLRFFINISHELRAPLTLIITPLQEMISKVQDVWMRKQLKYIYRNSQRLLHLVNQLMDYRRAELGVFKLKVRKENVQRIVRENWAYYENLARHKKLKYTLDSDIEEETVYADGQYLELILNNLISNAFKYTDSGEVSVSAHLVDGNLQIEVRDTGIGIPANQQDKIFERFFQADNRSIGSGIGLSLVYRLVELHHGKLEMSSEEGRGTAFKVVIPQSLEAYSEDELDLQGVEKQEIHTTNPKEMFIIDSDPKVETAIEQEGDKSYNVLVVEDNDEIRGYMGTGMAAYYNMFFAANGQEALDIIGKERIDLVVTDMMMPVMDGMKLCSKIKHESATRHIPVIMISGNADSKDELKALKTGADDFIPKPFSMAVLNTKIRNMLRHKPSAEGDKAARPDMELEKITWNAADEDFLRQAEAVVIRNLDKAEFSVDEFAGEMKLSRSGLFRKFKNLTGESALDFILRVRFKEACRLLEEGRLSISQIADVTGFSSASYFSTCFRKYHGCLPSEYARLHKE